ncbi:protease complex subunit PrcB family protein [Melghirimyces algeriensis]|uniref:PrcB C-terminal n=1 Tax=Melghirimyces algeriensis TaxID=910412 RepID=A0A521CQQ6_9BACL|nr:protease complex subunit PrcB family protein [Melghirimyces algeriensis]SMO61804.1 PrcB C-terminal [Melghirimyces algeriensis]
MKLWKVALLMMFLVGSIGISGCGSLFASDDSRGGTADSEEQSLSFKEESMEQLPVEVQHKHMEVMNASKDGLSHTEVRHGDKTYIILSLGQRPTGGYSIRVNEVVKKGTTIHVIAEEMAPSKETITTQAISHPFTVISLKTPDQDVQFTYKVQEAPKKENAANHTEFETAESFRVNDRTEDHH